VKVSGKLLLILGVVAAVPLAIAAVTSHATYEAELERNVRELHARTAEYGARSATTTLDAVERTTQGLAQTIPWSALTGEELHGALILVNEQFVDTAAVTLYDANGHELATTIGDVLAGHPRVAPAELRAVSASTRARGSLFSLHVPVAGRDGASWSLVVVYALRGLCSELAASAPAHVAVRVVDASGSILCGKPSLAGSLLTATAQGPRGWRVIAEQSRDVAFAALSRLRLASVFWIAVALCAAIVAGLVLSRTIRKPLRSLSSAAGALATGKLGERVDVTGDDEFAAVARAFNHMSDEIQQWTRQLEQRVAARTAELKDAQDQLLQSRKLGAVAALGAGIAHEISNPLSGVLGMAQLLLARKDKLDERSLRNVASIEREALRIREIVERMSKLAQDATVDAVRVDLGHVVDAVAAANASRLATAGIALERTVPKGLPQVLGNPAQLEHVLSQLVDNSIRAMPKGGRLDLRVRSVEGELIALDVADTGKGIPPELIDKVFEPFYTTKENWQGLGLGLAVAHRIVEAHRGRIRASSQVGVGTTMTLLFPTAVQGAHLQ
jgi:signal transduction histidine kinase